MQKANSTIKMHLLFSFIILFILSIYPYTFAGVVTIDFDELPDGTSIEHGVPITEAYAEWGVILNCHGLYPDNPIVDDSNAYVYSDYRASSGNNVIGGNIFGDYYHWLNFNICYGVATFIDPVDYVSIYGAGDSFQLFYYDQYGNKKGPFASGAESFVEVIPEMGVVIKKIEFGSYTGAYYTYFDDLTFNVASSDPVIVEISPDYFEPGSIIRVIGRNFSANPADERTIHIGHWRQGGPDSRRVYWTDTEIKVKIPRYGCNTFQDGATFRRAKVWVSVNGTDSNSKILKALRPAICE